MLHMGNITIDMSLPNDNISIHIDRKLEFNVTDLNANVLTKIYSILLECHYQTQEQKRY